MSTAFCKYAVLKNDDWKAERRQWKEKAGGKTLIHHNSNVKTMLIN